MAKKKKSIKKTLAKKRRKLKKATAACKACDKKLQALESKYEKLEKAFKELKETKKNKKKKAKKKAKTTSAEKVKKSAPAKIQTAAKPKPVSKPKTPKATPAKAQSKPVAKASPVKKAASVKKPVKPVSKAPKPTESQILDKIKKNASQVNFGRIGKANPSQKDNLKRIRGIGPFLEKRLNALGIYQFVQISKFTAEDELAVNTAIEYFQGRIQRDEWVKQAKALLS